MEELVTLFESLGFRNVRTYLQSGNVIFDSTISDIKYLSNAIEIKIKQAFNLSVAVLLRTPGELQRIIDKNPFLEEEGIDAGKLHVTFLSGLPSKAEIAQIKETYAGPDRFVIVDREIYLYCPDGYARTRFSNAFLEKKLGLTATTRNWKTVNALLDISGKKA